MTSAAAPSSPIRLLYVTRLAFTHWAFLKDQNEFLRTRGFVLHATAADDRYLRRLHERDGVVCHPVEISPRGLFRLRDLRAVVSLYRIMRRVRPHIVHLSTPKAALLGAIAARAANVPVRIFVIRGSAATLATGARRRLYGLLERFTAAMCNDIVCNCHSLRTFLEQERIIDRGRGFIAANGSSNGVDVERFCPGPEPSGAPVLGFVGRLARAKGIDELAVAWTHLRVEHPSLRLLLVGRWDDDHPVTPSTRAALESDPRVEITGHVEDVLPYLRRMSVAVFPSRGGEGIVNAILEAQAVGIPVVGTEVVGITDTIADGVTGTLVPLHDLDALGSAVTAYLNDEELRRAHGRAGRQRVAALFAPVPIWSSMYEHYVSLCRSIR